MLVPDASQIALLKTQEKSRVPDFAALLVTLKSDAPVDAKLQLLENALNEQTEHSIISRPQNPFLFDFWGHFGRPKVITNHDFLKT